MQNQRSGACYHRNANQRAQPGAIRHRAGEPASDNIRAGRKKALRHHLRQDETRHADRSDQTDNRKRPELREAGKIGEKHDRKSDDRGQRA
jgi:hypothetical protein